jgi:isocitrate/isopropylmalate dehydrogenase
VKRSMRYLSRSASVTISAAGHKPGVFEPCHGSAPDIAGTDKVTQQIDAIVLFFAHHTT